ncbi:hypothetical protein MIND_00388400 [Mycena indigotica]|uniref:Uncharacterized protein n=1 Tax=Mycena indigotica TaxID=2126181 RepID=A0A8H6T668_9AGAR|nr:uncharacterized protein MIND_00388400 [Mycena indigotica]KAF7310150.1 hypothetical protein MIND_00388400 [Mycena indigotica]
MFVTQTHSARTPRNYYPDSPFNAPRARGRNPLGSAPIPGPGLPPWMTPLDLGVGTLTHICPPTMGFVSVTPQTKWLSIRDGRPSKDEVDEEGNMIPESQEMDEEWDEEMDLADHKFTDISLDNHDGTEPKTTAIQPVRPPNVQILANGLRDVVASAVPLQQARNDVEISTSQINSTAAANGLANVLGLSALPTRTETRWQHGG